MIAISLEFVPVTAGHKRDRLSILVLVSLVLLLAGLLHAATMPAPARTDETIAFLGP